MKTTGLTIKQAMNLIHCGFGIGVTLNDFPKEVYVYNQVTKQFKYKETNSCYDYILFSDNIWNLVRNPDGT